MSSMTTTILDLPSVFFSSTRHPFDSFRLFRKRQADAQIEFDASTSPA